MPGLVPGIHVFGM